MKNVFVDLRCVGIPPDTDGDYPLLTTPPGTLSPSQRQALRDRQRSLLAQSPHGTQTYRRAQAYWMARLDSLPGPPRLPWRHDAVPPLASAPRVQLETRVDGARWQRLQSGAREHGISPSVMLLAVYAQILARWSSEAHFSVLLRYADASQLPGQSDGWLMHEVDGRRTDLVFSEFAAALQRQFVADLGHRSFGGLSVGQAWSRRRGTTFAQALPVAFSTWLAPGVEPAGDPARPGGDGLGSLAGQGGAHPQAWLDHQVMAQQGELVVRWQVVAGRFEPGVPEAMFAAHAAALERLADEATAWYGGCLVSLPPAMLARREAVHADAGPPARHRLHAGFVANALRQPDAPALLAAGRCMSYRELLDESLAVADQLLHAGMVPGRAVAVLMAPGWEQVVAVCGVLLAGAAWLPMDTDWSPARQLDVLRTAGVSQLIARPEDVDAALRSGEWAVHHPVPGARAGLRLAHVQSLAGPPEQPACLVFKFGPGGEPGGVVMDHQGLVNTLVHLNRLHRVGPDDRALGVSSPASELSIYDVFGMLHAGGTLVLPDTQRRRDPLHWHELVRRCGVSVWNSGPRLLLDLLEADPEPGGAPLPLRLLLLSGAALAPGLPERIRRRCGTAEIVHLLGAAETSIWSACFPLGEAGAGRPRGRPLPNQTARVYDPAFRPCPDHVAGRLFIGGTGLSRGYWHAPAGRDAPFIRHPRTRERLYDSGIEACHAPDGSIVWLGERAT